MSFFLVPIEGTGTRADPFRPKYIPALGVQWSMVDFGSIGICWANATSTQETAITANSDAVLVPPLDNVIAAGALATVRNAVEALHVPAKWITAGMTYRSIVKALVGMAQLTHRMAGMGVKLVLAGNLDSTISAFPNNAQTVFAAAIDSLGLNRSAIVGSTTLRAALLNIGQQFVQGNAIILGDL